MSTQVAMAKGFIGSQQLQLVVEVDDWAMDTKVILRATLDQDTAELVFIVSIDPNGAQVATQTMQVSGALAGCLAGCGYASSQPIIECAKKSKNIADFRKCVSGKGMKIAGQVLECLVGCLMLHLATP
jgi:hypothetical protein